MSRVGLFAFMLMLVLVSIGGCGGSSKSSRSMPSQTPRTSAASATTEPAVTPQTASGHTLTRAQLIVKANIVCDRLNAKRRSTRIAEPQDYERYVAPLARYEIAAAAQMRRIKAPTSLAATWRQIADSTQTIGEVMTHYRNAAAAAHAMRFEKNGPTLKQAVKLMTDAAARDGITGCAKFE